MTLYLAGVIAGFAIFAVTLLAASIYTKLDP
jgi:hypothetical protein